MMMRWIAILMAWGLAVPAGSSPGLCVAHRDTYCSTQCGEVGGGLTCFDASSERCCFEGPNTCGETMDCPECTSCGGAGGF